ncbi:MAG: hypothetical protein PHW69_05575 [Elusimicrobiaceae bacterium]|nr:hypothetical protein [Elusimicrobiaceae bacterium]
MYKWIFLALFAGAVYFHSAETNQYRKIRDILPEAAGVPVQTELDGNARPVRCSAGGYEWEMTPLYNYEATAFVFGVSHNALSGQKGLVPADLGLLWGDNARHKYYRNVKLRVMLNHYSVSWKGKRLFNMHAAANTHCATCDSATAAKLRAVAPGDQIRIRGRLINAKIFKEGSATPMTWNTSVTRNDTGEGSCELLYVAAPQDVEILKPATRFNKYMFRFCAWAIPALGAFLFIRQYRQAKKLVEELHRLP